MSYFENCMYFSVNQLARHLNKIADDAFKEINITPTQGFALISIGELNKHTPSEIANELEMTPSTITRFLDRLDKLGYIERKYLGRNTEINLTEKGKRTLVKVSECWGKIHDVNVKVFSEELAKTITNKTVKANKLFKETIQNK